MPDDHLFEPNDLFDVKDFGKVRISECCHVFVGICLMIFRVLLSLIKFFLFSCAHSVFYFYYHAENYVNVDCRAGQTVLSCRVF